jgi:hypothetical protein
LSLFLWYFWICIKRLKFFLDDPGQSAHHPDGAVVIAVHFEFFQRTGPQEHVCRIPVPDGKEAEGNDVAQQIAVVNGVAFATSAEETDITA